LLKCLMKCLLLAAEIGTPKAKSCTKNKQGWW
jgi:hypothetical protein